MNRDGSLIQRFKRRVMTVGSIRAAFLTLAVLILSFGETLAQVDITEIVRRTTPLNRTIQDFCASYCQGNESEGRLASVVVRPVGGGRYRGSTVVDLRNRQEMGDPFNVTVFDWTVRVYGEGLLNADTCTMVIDSVTVENDLYGLISSLLNQYEGQTYPIPNCRKFLP